MPDFEQQTERSLTRAQQIFLDAPEEYRALLKEVLKVERQVMHLKRRSDIHQRIYDHIKRVIK